jgi:hypothetical protein
LPGQCFFRDDSCAGTLGKTGQQFAEAGTDMSVNTRSMEQCFGENGISTDWGEDQYARAERCVTHVWHRWPI